MALQIKSLRTVYKIRHIGLHIAGSIGGRTQNGHFVIPERGRAGGGYIVEIGFGHTESFGYSTRGFGRTSVLDA